MSAASCFKALDDYSLGVSRAQAFSEWNERAELVTELVKQYLAWIECVCAEQGSLTVMDGALRALRDRMNDGLSGRFCSPSLYGPLSEEEGILVKNFTARCLYFATS